MSSKRDTGVEGGPRNKSSVATSSPRLYDPYFSLPYFEIPIPPQLKDAVDLEHSPENDKEYLFAEHKAQIHRFLDEVTAEMDREVGPEPPEDLPPIVQEPMMPSPRDMKVSSARDNGSTFAEPQVPKRPFQLCQSLPPVHVQPHTSQLIQSAQRRRSGPGPRIVTTSRQILLRM